MTRKVYSGKKKKAVFAHQSHIDSAEYSGNLVIAKILADSGLEVTLLPVSSFPYSKNPDARIGESEFEFKSVSKGTFHAVDQIIRRGAKQADRLVVRFQGKIKIRIVELAIYDRARRTSNIMEIIVILHDRITRIKRKEITSKSFLAK